MRVKVTPKKKANKKHAKKTTEVVGWIMSKVFESYPEEEQFMDLILFGKLDAKRYHNVMEKIMRAK